MSIADRLGKLDSSVAPEFRVYTLHGAILSVGTLVVILYLVATEYSYNLTVVQKERVFANATSPTGLDIEFDLTLRNIPCSQLKVDALDPNGEPQSLHLDRSHQIYKHRIKYLDEQRKRFTLVGQKTQIELGSTLLSSNELERELESVEEVEEEEEEIIECGDCYGAGEEGECCNTCEDVKKAYRRMGWYLKDLSSVKQCHKEAKLANALGDEDEGCNIHGTIALSTGGGDFHIAPGKDPQSNDFTILDMLLQTFQTWNVTHTIHKFRFGPDYPSSVYQLDDESRSIQDVYGMQQYYFKVVPTTYRYRNGTVLHTNQYSVTEHLRHVTPGSNRGYVPQSSASNFPNGGLTLCSVYPVFSSFTKSLLFTLKYRKSTAQDGLPFSRASARLLGASSRRWACWILPSSQAAEASLAS